MESLETLMEPKEFKEYCDEVNDARKSKDAQYDPRHVQPEQFSPQSDKSVLKGLLAEDKKIRDANMERTNAQREAAEKREQALKKEYKKLEEEFEKSMNKNEPKTEKTTSGKGEPTL